VGLLFDKFSLGSGTSLGGARRRRRPWRRPVLGRLGTLETKRECRWSP